MPDRLAQGGPTLDLTALGDAIWGAFFSHLGDLGTATWAGIQAHLGEIGTAIWTSLAAWTYAGMRSFFLSLWNISLFTIPHELSDRAGPVVALMPPSGAIAAAGLVLAFSIIGLRTILSGVFGRGAALDEVLPRLAVYAAALSMLPWIVARAIDLEQSLTAGITEASLAATIPEFAPLDLASWFSLLLMIIFGIRLWLKMSSNVVHVMVAIIWSPVAMVLGLIPHTAWVTGLWTREFGGRLAGVALAASAIAVGMALAFTHGSALLYTGVAGAFMAAYDYVDWLAKTPGSNLGGLVGWGARVGAAAVMSGGGGASAGAQAAGMRALSRSDAASATEAFYSYD